jgi:ribonuclease HI
MEAYNMAELNQRQTGEVSTLVGASRVPRWQRPNEGVVKINWDAAISMLGDRMGVGVVARDHNGNVVGALCCMRPFISDPTTAEAVGAWQAVMFGKQFRVDNVIFKGDSLDVVNAMKRGNSCWAKYGMMVNAAKEGLQTIPTWDFHHTRREGNGATHRLAKQAFVFGEMRVWLGVSPFCIHDVLIVDNSSFVE